MTAQDRLDARNAHLRRSLQDHADRVARRRNDDRQPVQAATASDRILALRARVAARQRARQSIDGGQVGQAADEQAGSSVGSSGRRRETDNEDMIVTAALRTSKEDAKIHLLYPASGIQVPTASRQRRGEEGGGVLEAEAAADAAASQADGRPAEGDPLVQAVVASARAVPPAGAMVAATHQVAWHTAVRHIDSAP